MARIHASTQSSGSDDDPSAQQLREEQGAVRSARLLNTARLDNRHASKPQPSHPRSRQATGTQGSPTSAIRQTKSSGKLKRPQNVPAAGQKNVLTQENVPKRVDVYELPQSPAKTARPPPSSRTAKLKSYKETPKRKQPSRIKSVDDNANLEPQLPSSPPPLSGHPHNAAIDSDKVSEDTAHGVNSKRKVRDPQEDDGRTSESPKRHRSQRLKDQAAKSMDTKTTNERRTRSAAKKTTRAPQPTAKRAAKKHAPTRQPSSGAESADSSDEDESLLLPETKKRGKPPKNSYDPPSSSTKDHPRPKANAETTSRTTRPKTVSNGREYEETEAQEAEEPTINIAIRGKSVNKNQSGEPNDKENSPQQREGDEEEGGGGGGAAEDQEGDVGEEAEQEEEEAEVEVDDHVEEQPEEGNQLDTVRLDPIDKVFAFLDEGGRPGKCRTTLGRNIRRSCDRAIANLQTDETTFSEVDRNTDNIRSLLRNVHNLDVSTQPIFKVDAYGYVFRALTTYFEALHQWLSDAYKDISDSIEALRIMAPFVHDMIHFKDTIAAWKIGATQRLQGDVLIKDVNINLISPLRMVDKEYQELLHTLEATEKAKQRHEQLMEMKRVRAEQQKRKDEAAATRQQRRSRWQELHAVRLQCEPPFSSHRQRFAITWFEDLEERDANGMQFERIPVFRNRTAPPHAWSSAAEDTNWSDDQLSALIYGLERFAGPRVFENIFRSYCTYGGLLQEFTVRDITLKAAEARFKFLSFYQSQGLNAPEWVEQIPLLP